MLAWALGWNDYDWAGAQREFKRALDLDPQNGETHLRYGFVLEVNGRFPEAEREIRTALSLHTTFATAETALMGLYFMMGDCARVEQEGQRMLVQTPRSPRLGSAHELLAECAE